MSDHLARQFLQAWTAGRSSVVDELAAETLVVSYTHFPEPLHGPEAFKKMLAQTHRSFPDLTITAKEVVADEDEGQAVVSWTYRGTFQEGTMFGVEASGQPVEVAGMTRYHVANGKIQQERGLVDNFGLMTQLGAGPETEDQAR